MQSRTPLYRPGPAWGEVPTNLPLIALMTGYRDAGSTTAQITQTLMGSEPGDLIAAFDPDPLFDYRARRPVMFIEEGEVKQYLAPSLELRLLVDEAGAPFLLLSGFEPDFCWRQFVDDVLTLIDHFGVASTTWVHAVPLPVPHTRPIRLTMSGNRREFIEQLSSWTPRTEVPAHVLHLLEFELTAAGDPVLDIVPLVPHYLAEGVVPAAALRAIEAIAEVTSLVLPTEELRDEDRVFTADVDRQVAENEEAQRLVAALEVQHDDFVKDLHDENPLTDENGSLPSADELAAELERFLSNRRDSDF